MEVIAITRTGLRLRGAVYDFRVGVVGWWGTRAGKRSRRLWACGRRRPEVWRRSGPRGRQKEGPGTDCLTMGGRGWRGAMGGDRGARVARGDHLPRGGREPEGRRAGSGQLALVRQGGAREGRDVPGRWAREWFDFQYFCSCEGLLTAKQSSLLSIQRAM